MNIRTWAGFERILFFLFLLGRIALFFDTFGQAAGFDKAHLLIVDSMSLSNPLSYGTYHGYFNYYGYHPPLSFALAAASKAAWHLSTVQSVQLVSAAASLISFLFLRKTLALLHLLNSPRAICFLYITSTLPVQIYLAHSINIEALILSEASAALYFAVALTKRIRMRSDAMPVSRTLTIKSLFLGWQSSIPYSAGLVLCLTCALLTKGSGLLLFALPVLVCSSRLSGKELKRSLIIVSCSAALAILLAMPYFVLRPLLYVQSSAPFPAVDSTDVHAVQAGIEKEKHPVKFLVELFKADPDLNRDLQCTDNKQPRLIDAWRDFWAQNGVNGCANGIRLLIEETYYVGGSVLAVTGLAVFICSLRNSTSSWMRLGVPLFLFSLLQVMALAAYTYKYPSAWSDPVKGIYICPVTWFVGYAIASLIDDWSCNRITMIVLGAILVPVMMINSLMPIY